MQTHIKNLVGKFPTHTKFAAEAVVNRTRVPGWLEGKRVPSTADLIKLAILASNYGLAEEATYFLATAGLRANPGLSGLLASSDDSLKSDRVIATPYAGEGKLPFKVEVPAALVLDRASLRYVVAGSKGGAGRFVGQGDIIVFEARHDAFADAGERVVFRFKDGLYVGLLSYLGEGASALHLVIGPPDGWPNNWQLSVTRDLRVLWTEPGGTTKHEADFGEYLGIWRAQFYVEAPKLLKQWARMGAPKGSAEK